MFKPIAAQLGRGGGQVVSVFAFYSDDPSLSPAEAYSFFCNNLCLKRTKIGRGWPKKSRVVTLATQTLVYLPRYDILGI